MGIVILLPAYDLLAVQNAHLKYVTFQTIYPKN